MIRFIFIFISILQFTNAFGQEDQIWSRNFSVKSLNRLIDYRVDAGFMTIAEEDSTKKASVFYIAYTEINKKNNSLRRPVTYTFNGGPGSSSVWLHMGGLGPKRVLLDSIGNPLKPPYEYVDNPYTWLEFTDLVFIDPVMTGFSRPETEDIKKEFTGYEEDIRSVGKFIYQYTSANNRWGDPKFLAGESYGTTRAAGLSHYLQSRYGMYLNGLVLVSSIMNFQTARFNRGNDLPYILFLPTYSATAWYHGKITDYESLDQLLQESERFALGEYASALFQGNKLSIEERSNIINKLASLTGLSENWIEDANLRIEIGRFTKELKRKEGLTIGRLDSRFTGFDYDNAGERFEFDPSYDYAIYGPYATVINDYLRREIGVKTDLPYEILTGRIRPWNYNNVQNEYLNVAEELRKAMHRNPYLKVHICNGYFDLATPYFATEFTIRQMGLAKELEENISQSYYESGHMMYIHYPSLIKFTEEVHSFYTQTLTEKSQTKKTE